VVTQGVPITTPAPNYDSIASLLNNEVRSSMSCRRGRRLPRGSPLPLLDTTMAASPPMLNNEIRSSMSCRRDAICICVSYCSNCYFLRFTVHIFLCDVQFACHYTLLFHYSIPISLLALYLFL
jgi:hypothetical protein